MAHLRWNISGAVFAQFNQAFVSESGGELSYRVMWPEILRLPPSPLLLLSKTLQELDRHFVYLGGSVITAISDIVFSGVACETFKFPINLIISIG